MPGRPAAPSSPAPPRSAAPASNTQIDQSSQRAAIDWQSFDVGSQQSVTFNQPSASAVALNRVTGPDPSQIAGRIDANGQIILVNQSGVNFYKGAQVNAAGVMVSAANISNQNFMAGVMKFDQPGNPNAKIDNQGTITVKQAGLAALVAPQVANSGTINAKLGHVVLAGAKTATLDLYGDGLLSLDVTNQVTQAPVGQGRQGGDRAGDQHRRDHRRWRHGAAHRARGRRHRAEPGAGRRHDPRGDDGGSDRHRRAERRRRLDRGGGAAVRAGQCAGDARAARSRSLSNGTWSLASTARIDASGQAGGGVAAIGTTLARPRAARASRRRRWRAT